MDLAAPQAESVAVLQRIDEAHQAAGRLVLAMVELHHRERSLDHGFGRSRLHRGAQSIDGRSMGLPCPLSSATACATEPRSGGCPMVAVFGHPDDDIERSDR